MIKITYQILDMEKKMFHYINVTNENIPLQPGNHGENPFFYIVTEL